MTWGKIWWREGYERAHYRDCENDGEEEGCGRQKEKKSKIKKRNKEERRVWLKVRLKNALSHGQFSLIPRSTLRREEGEGEAPQRQCSWIQ